MFTIGTAAYKLYSASQNVGSTLSTLSNYHKYVTEAIFNSPSEVENLHPLVKQNLDRLARRIQVLSKPLNYCLLWSQHRGSAVAETIHQCKEVLKQTYHWLHKCNKDKTKLSDKEYMLKKLDEHIREIDFCLQSLNLALSIIQTTDNIINPFHHTNDSDSDYISPSSLLTASNRIMAMHNSGGDVAICFGQLFKKSIKDNCGWQRIYRRSALKIYRNRMGRRYELRIECNEYGYDSDDMYNMNHSHTDFTLNTSHPLTLKFDLTSSVYFTTLSSLLIDLPHRNNSSFINIQHINKNELIEDAFGWVQMLANQVQEQYIFVLKSGLDDWDQPLSSSDDEQPQQPQPQHSPINKQPLKNKRVKQTSLIFLKDGARQNSLDEEHEIVYTKSRRSLSDDQDDSDDISEQQDTIQPLPPSSQHHHYNNNNNTQQQSTVNSVEHDEHDPHLTASIASLDTAVQRTRHRTHLGQLLAPGGDYDESHVTPQLMAYMTRLAIYENDYTKPHTVYHTNSTFKKYKSSQQQPKNHENDDDEEEEEEKSDGKEQDSDTDDVDESEEPDNQSVMISTSLTKQESNASGGSSSTEISEYDLTNDDHSSEFTHHQTDSTKIFPSQHTIKQQQKIPAHLSACDEELNLFLQNPPSPPIPFYPTHIHFVSTSSSSTDQYQNQQQTYSRRQRQKKKNHQSQNVISSPQRKKYGSSPARQYKRLNARRSNNNAQSVTNNKSYFAAPKVNEVTITYPNVIHNRNDDNNNNHNHSSSLLHEHNNKNNNNENLLLSISDENHMKYMKKDKDKKLELTPKSKESMAAIKDATNSSLLENVDLTTSQTFSANNSPRNNRNAHHNDDDDEHMLHGNFANLSIDNDD